MRHLFDDIDHPITSIRPKDGVKQYRIHSILAEFSTTEDDWGYTVADEDSVTIHGLVFGDWDEVHHFDWKDGKYEDKPEVMPITDEQFRIIKNLALEYVQENITEIEPWS